MDVLSKFFLSKQYGTRLVYLGVGVSLIFVLAFVQPALAQDEDDENQDRLWTQQTCEAEGGVWQGSDVCRFTDRARETNPNFLVERYLIPITRFLAAIVGLVVIISVVIGGIQYSSAGDNPQKISQAKGRILNSMLALLVFFLLYGLLEWIVPGGFL